MRIKCWECQKPVTTELPKGTIFRGTALCPECEEKQLEAAELLRALEKLVTFDPIYQSADDYDRLVESTITAIAKAKK